MLKGSVIWLCLLAYLPGAQPLQQMGYSGDTPGCAVTTTVCELACNSQRRGKITKKYSCKIKGLDSPGRCGGGGCPDVETEDYCCAEWSRVANFMYVAGFQTQGDACTGTTIKPCGSRTRTQRNATQRNTRSAMQYHMRAYTCLCTCLCTWKLGYTQVCTHVSANVYAHIAAHVYIHVYTHVYRHIATHVYTHVYTHVHTHVYAHMLLHCPYRCLDTRL